MEETSKIEILSAINEFATKTELRFQKAEKHLAAVGAKMVTKEYLDDKLADLKGDLITVVRKENTKVVALINILRKRNILSDDDTTALLSMEPFPDLRASLSL